jgi:hypothetical protein
MPKVLISLPPALLRQLDETAVARGMSRSSLVAGLIEAGLGDTRGPGASAEVHAAFRRSFELDQRASAMHGEPEDPTRAIRDMRDARWGT